MNAIAKEVFVVSDLHIGGEYAAVEGERGFRINTNVADLCQFFTDIRERAKSSKIPTELVINGDFLDFLAEKVPPEQNRKSFIEDQQQALDAFKQIVKRDSLVFDELNKLLDAGVSLTVLLGNHDIELSLPIIRDHLSNLLNLNAGRKFKFIYDGEAYLIGDVLIEHGNRYDGWNTVDFDVLRRFRSLCSRGLEISADADFSPPAGSELVELIMNPIKEDYPFIDLLKPETGAAVPFLLALEPSFANIANAVEVVRLKSKAKWHDPKAPATPRQPGNFGQTESPLQQVLEQQISDASIREDLLRLVQKAEAEKRNMSGNMARRVLSFAQLDNYEQRLQILLVTLRSLQHDKSFDKEVESATAYLEAAQTLAKNKAISTVVFGHTHLAKEVKIADGKKYINTGTWADLMTVSDDIISGSEETAMKELRKFAEAIRTKQFDDYINFHPYFAYIAFNDAEVNTVSKLIKYNSADGLQL